MIKGFNGDHFYLSNYYECKVEVNDILFPSSEHAYQAQKSRNIEDQKYVRDASNPDKAKSRGREIHSVEDWYEVKPLFMQDVVWSKFTQNPELQERLIDTGDQYLEEANDWGDTYWGTVDGEGKNMLGKILMRVRKKLQKSMELKDDFGRI